MSWKSRQAAGSSPSSTSPAGTSPAAQPTSSSPDKRSAWRRCFRTPLADRFILNLVNRCQITTNDFDTLPGGAVSLSENGRKTVLTAWQEWRSEEREHALLGRNVPHGLLPVVQARLLARHLRGELPGYIPWTPH
jgi:CRISPR associated protein Cas1